MKETNVNDQEPIKWRGLLNEFLWICAGVNRKLVRQCPTDYAKYAGQGGLILFTGLMAMLSGGYAFYTVFDSFVLATAFGIFWGLLIFNLDRFIVNTMYSDGKHTISWFELMAGLPRIIIAIFLGIVISTPLELKIFEDEINLTISDMKKEMAIQYSERDNQAIDKLEEKKKILNMKIDSVQNTPASLYAGSITTGNTTLNNLLAERKTKQNEYNHAIEEIQKLKDRRFRLSETDTIEYKRLTEQIFKQQKIANSANHTISSLDGSIGSQDRNIRDLIDKSVALKESIIDGYKTDIANIDLQIKRLTIKRDNAAEEYDVELEQKYGGFQARMKAFNRMREDKSTLFVSLFIMLMFIIIEIAPTFFKMMVASGPYDDLLRIESEKKKVYADEVIGKLRNELNTALTISTKTNKEKEDIELQNNKELLTKIANIQSEVLEVAIQKWREEELEKANKNPSTFISKS